MLVPPDVGMRRVGETALRRRVVCAWDDGILPGWLTAGASARPGKGALTQRANYMRYQSVTRPIVEISYGTQQHMLCLTTSQINF